MTRTTRDRTPLQVRQHRARLAEAMRVLQRCSTSPVGDPVRWRRELAEATERLDEVLADHVEVTDRLGELRHGIEAGADPLILQVALSGLFEQLEERHSRPDPAPREHREVATVGQ